jgi:RNA chaperone Hfq
MYSSIDCQSKYLSVLAENRATVSVILKSGVKLTGKIIGVTNDIIFLNSPAPQMVYKKWVRSIVPE